MCVYCVSCKNILAASSTSGIGTAGHWFSQWTKILSQKSAGWRVSIFCMSGHWLWHWLLRLAKTLLHQKKRHWLCQWLGHLVCHWPLNRICHWWFHWLCLWLWYDIRKVIAFDYWIGYAIGSTIDYIIVYAIVYHNVTLVMVLTMTIASVKLKARLWV